MTIGNLPAPWRGCAAGAPDTTFMLISQVPNCTLSLLFLALTLRKLVQSHKMCCGKLTWKSLCNLKSTGTPLLLAFVCDGSTFFVLTSCVEVLRAAVLYTAGWDPSRKVIVIEWIFVFNSYAGVHLILDLRVRGLKGDTEQTWNETMSIRWQSLRGVQSIRFA